MAKSRETYNKKEVEKKKLKKKQDKREKKEARKANSPNQDFEGMLAYVDEDGNITSTPPDPTRKKTVIDPTEIQIGIPRQEKGEAPDPIKKGTVTFFNSSKGYGFIKEQDSQNSVFVHLNGLIDTIADHDKVTFEIEMTPRGPSAVNVKLAD